MIGKTVSHDRILEKLGGGMGVVYKAEDLKLHGLFPCATQAEFQNSEFTIQNSFVA